jgi:hypothetical protein
VIFTAINFLAVVFFVPETRYNRGSEFAALEESISSTSEDELDGKNITRLSEKAVTGSSQSHTAQQVPKRTYVQGLSLWSGVPSDTNLAEMFIRPLPLILYPAIVFAL